VLGFDSERSTDHGWGPRLLVLVDEHEVEPLRDTVELGLPDTFRGWPTRFGWDDVTPRHHVTITTLPAWLGDVLGLRIGDRPEIEVREGDRRTVRPVVVGFVEDSIGLSIYARAGLLAELEGDLGATSSALLRVDAREVEQVEAALRRSPSIIDISDAAGDMQRLLDMNSSIMNVWTVISIALSGGIVFGVVYNNARIGLAAWARELASLRVLGFNIREISAILLASQAIEVALAVPAGLWLGRVWAEWFMSSMDPETFRWAVVVAPRTYLLSAVVTVLAAMVSALWVRRNLDTLDLVAVLKARE